MRDCISLTELHLALLVPAGTLSALVLGLSLGCSQPLFLITLLPSAICLCCPQTVVREVKLFFACGLFC